MDQEIDRELQEVRYSFPYHYIPHYVRTDQISIIRCLDWGIEYLSYMMVVSYLINNLKVKSLLDIGCGDGRLIHMLNQNIPIIRGHDISKQALRFAKAFNPNIKFYNDDLGKIEEIFECISLIETLEHIPEEEIKELNENLIKLTQPNGYLIISVPTTNIPLIKKHYRHYDLKLLKKHVNPRFKLKKTFFIYRNGLRSRIYKFLMFNSVFLLNFAPIMRILYKQHQKYTLFANEKNSRHIVALFQKMKSE